MAGVEWDGMIGNTGEVGEFRKRKKADSEESVKINVIFAEERGKIWKMPGSPTGGPSLGRNSYQ